MTTPRARAASLAGTAAGGVYRPLDNGDDAQMRRVMDLVAKVVAQVTEGKAIIVDTRKDDAGTTLTLSPAALPYEVLLQSTLREKGGPRFAVTKTRASVADTRLAKLTAVAKRPAETLVVRHDAVLRLPRPLWQTGLLLLRNLGVLALLVFMFAHMVGWQQQPRAVADVASAE